MPAVIAVGKSPFLIRLYFDLGEHFVTVNVGLVKEEHTIVVFVVPVVDEAPVTVVMALLVGKSHDLVVLDLFSLMVLLVSVDGLSVVLISEGFWRVLAVGAHYYSCKLTIQSHSLRPLSSC